MTKQKQPQYRFDGFDGEWEEKKLGEIFIQTKDFINPTENKIELWSLTVKDGIVPKTERYERSFLVKKNDNFKLLKPGEFVYNPMNMTLGAIGYNTLYKPIAVSGYYITMKSSEYIDDNFIFEWMKTNKAIQKYKDNATGSLIEKQRVQFPTLSDIKFSLPSLPEQEAIGELFQTVDQLIQLQDQKLATLKEQKQTFLRKMFPAQGQKAPEIRLQGFDGEWEEKKLGEVLLKNNKKNKNLAVINVESVSNKFGFLKQTEQFEDYSVASSDLSNYYVVTEKQFAYNPSRINVGSIAYKNIGEEPSVVSPLYVTFSTKNNLSDSFVWYWFKTSNFEKQRQIFSEGGVRDTLSFNLLSEIILIFPSLSEQEAIGDFFQTLDQQMSQTEDKLIELKALKQTLLNRLFV